jgi:hypothetical protein
VNDVFALALEGASFVQNFEGGFGTEPRHAAGETEFILRRIFHGGKPMHYTPHVGGVARSYDAPRAEEKSEREVTA